MAPGFCTCKRDFPERNSFHPPERATWHYLCDKPVLPLPVYPEPGAAIPPEFNGGQDGYVVGQCGHRVAGQEWRAGFRNCERCGDSPPEYDPEWAATLASGTLDGEAQRIAEVFDEARAELDRGI